MRGDKLSLSASFVPLRCKRRAPRRHERRREATSPFRDLASKIRTTRNLPSPPVAPILPVRSLPPASPVHVPRSTTPFPHGTLKTEHGKLHKLCLHRF